MNAILAFLLRLLFILLSYAFVGWIVYTIFSDLRRTIREKKTISVPPLTLNVTLDQEIEQKSFAKPDNIIGRDPACDYSLNDNTISLRHCRLFYDHKQWWAEDLDSTNGSYLNEIRIEAPIVLTDGDRLRLGRINTSIQLN